MKLNNSKKLWQYSLKHLAGGVNSPVRAFNGVGGSPIFVKKAGGSKFTDVDGNIYIDFVQSWGVMIHGQADRDIQAAVAAANWIGATAIPWP